MTNQPMQYLKNTKPHQVMVIFKPDWIPNVRLRVLIKIKVGQIKTISHEQPSQIRSIFLAQKSNQNKTTQSLLTVKNNQSHNRIISL